MWGNVSVTFFPYASAGKKGIGCGLNGVQKTRNGDPLSGRVTAQDAFQPVAQAATPEFEAAMPATPGYAAGGYGNPAPQVTQAPGGWGTPAAQPPMPGEWGSAPGYTGGWGAQGHSQG